MKKRKRSSRRGAAALEFVLVSVIFVLTLLGMIELSRAVMVQQVVVNAAREGARRAVVPGATEADLTGENGVITHYLTRVQTGGTYTVTIYVNGEESSLPAANSHDQVTVQVSVPFSDVSWGILTFFPSTTVLSSAATMRKE
jgi:Flp pilus assembly protein TadG